MASPFAVQLEDIMTRISDLASKLRSKFVVLDGPDGCGKSTQQAMLADALLKAGGQAVTVRDPGTTSAGEEIRRIILSGDHGCLSAECELLLFMAARSQMMAENILPALKAGKTVLSDRFVSASCAYQGASGIDLKDIIELGQFATRSTWPDLTIVLDIPVELGLQRARIANGDEDLDAMECRPTDFHRKVRRIFLNLGGAYPGKVEIVDASGTVDQVHKQVVEVLRRVDF